MKKDISLSFLSALFLILSFPNFNLWIFAWFGFVPLFFAIEDKRPLKRFFLSYLAGIFFFFGTIYWLYHVSILGLILLVLYLALYFGIFGLFFSLVTGYWLLITLPAIWVLLEYLRSHLFTGFGWALLGYSQYLNLPIIQIADTTGVWGVSFLVMMVNVAIKEIIGFRLRASGFRRRGIYKFLFVACGLWLVACGYGFFKLNQRSDGKEVKVSVIQGNIPQEIKWEEEAKGLILERYFDLTKKVVIDSPDLIIWPEAALPDVISTEEDLKTIIALVEKKKIPILLGAVRREESLYFNSAILISPYKEIQRYDKIHLVPFGEYIPLKSIFRFLETIYPIGDFSAGREYTLLKFQIPNKTQPKAERAEGIKFQTFGVLICFEDIFPDLARGFVKRGADFLVVITNDAWFKETSAPYQHLSASVFRAVENRRFLIRAANTGISCFIAPKGEIISKVSNKRDIFVSGYKTQDIFLDKVTLSFYTKFGDYFVVLCLIISGCGIILYRKERKRFTAKNAKI